MQYLYRIMGQQILCEVPFEIRMQKIYESFVTEVAESGNDADVRMEFRETAEDIIAPKSIVWAVNQGYYREKVYYRSAPHGIIYACVDWADLDKGNLVCFYRKGCECYLNLAKNIVDLVSLEKLILKMDGLLLHASFVKWKERGILFTAPSGTGKSTQAALWEQWEKAEILNGDRAALCKRDNRWMAYGIPWAGSSGIFRNEAAGAEAVVIIRQSPYNKIRKIENKEAFFYLYPELTFHRWNEMCVKRVIDLLEMLMKDCPVYLLECRPDREAVHILKEIIKKGEEA